ncbi:hypothetical protein C4572_02000, partial [Candidatus Parcubacteria bacterium]
PKLWQKKRKNYSPSSKNAKIISGSSYDGRILAGKALHQKECATYFCDRKNRSHMKMVVEY